MKRIYINKRIIDVAEEYASKLCAVNELNVLENHLRTNYSSNQKHADYVKTIIDRYSELNKIQPQDFYNYTKLHFNNLTKKELKEKFTNPFVIPKAGKAPKQKEFHKLVADAMQYDVAKMKFYHYAREELKIKACIYCNAQLSVTIVIKDKINKTYEGMYDIDHFYPKSKYPYLCTSFFNFCPSCSNCNRKKSTHIVKFNLYTNDYDCSKINPFKFSLDKKSLVKYMLNQNCEELKIGFDSSETDLKDDHEKYFRISALYETQTDLAEEIVWKSKIYNESYQAILKKSFEKLSLKQSDFKRFILGNYYKQDDIHKRPMSKFVQDIAQQLKLI